MCVCVCVCRFLAVVPSLADSSESVSGQRPNTSVEQGYDLTPNLSSPSLIPSVIQSTGLKRSPDTAWCHVTTCLTCLSPLCFRSGLLSTLVGEKSVTQRWEVGVVSSSLSAPLLRGCLSLAVSSYQLAAIS